MSDPSEMFSDPMELASARIAATRRAIDPRPDDLAAVKAEGRRLLEDRTAVWPTYGDWSRARDRWDHWTVKHADALLADPAPQRADLGDRDSLLAQARVWAKQDQGIEALVAWLDELLADPAPEGLSEEVGWNVRLTGFDSVSDEVLLTFAVPRHLSSDGTPIRLSSTWRIVSPDRLSASTEATCSRCGGLGALDEHGGPRPVGTHGTHPCPHSASTEEGTDG